MSKVKTVSAANLPEDFKIIDPFDRDYLMSLPQEVLVDEPGPRKYLAFKDL